MTNDEREFEIAEEESLQVIRQPEIYHPAQISPAPPMEVVALAREQAKALMSVVEEAGSFAEIQGKKYLKVEGWELIGRFNRVSAVTEYVKSVGDPSEGYEAKVNLYQDGNIIGSGTMVCGLDEFVCQGKTGLAKDNACMSMAQTRATSKAYRLNFSWVAVLANFEATPAEEMQGQRRTTAPSDHLCPIHDVEWRQSAKQKAAGRGHSHKTDDGWCNMADILAEREVAAEKLTTEQAEAPKHKPTEQFTNMGSVLAKAYREYDLGFADIQVALGVDKPVKWAGTLDEAWNQITRWHEEMSPDPAQPEE